MHHHFRLRLVSYTLTLAVVGAYCHTASAQIRGHWRLQETAGTTAVDTSSYASNGTYTNGVSLATSTAVPFSGAIAATFDGSNDYIAIANEANFDFTSAMTVGCWIKITSFTKDSQAIVCKGNSAWRIQREGTTNYVAFCVNGLGTNKVVSTTSVNDGQWHHVVGVWTGSQLQIYIDGSLNNSVSTTGTPATNNFAVEIGRNGEVAGREFHGSIYNVIVLNMALPDTTIAAFRNWDGLTGHWRLNETSGTTAADNTLLLNAGTYTNGVVLASAGPYPGAGDKAANFDGTNDYVATPNEHYYDLSGPMSVAVWTKVDTFTKAWQAIVTKGDSAWRLARDNSNNTLRFNCSGLSTNSVASTTSVNDGAWHHVVGVYTGSQLQIYIDGALNNSVAATGVISRNAHAVQIGQNAEAAGREFDGSIYDVRVYSIPLSAARVAELYGLVGHWKLNATAGTAASDSSPFAQHGTVNGTAYWSTDCGGMKAFDFDGSSNYIGIANASHLQPTSAMTIAAWVRGDSWGAGDSVDAILRKGDTNPNNYQLSIADGRVALHLDDADSGGIRGNTVLATGRWYHVAAVWDGATVKIYVNGVLDNTPVARTAAIGTDARALHIGGRSGADQFDGMIRDVRFYNRALYETEIKSFAGMVGHWLFAEGSGSSAADSSGQGYTATLSGGATWTTDCNGYHALLTNGSGGIAQTNSPFRPPSEGTVAFWMRSSGTPAVTSRLFGVGPDWEVRQGNNGRLYFDLCGDANPEPISTNSLDEVGRWYHVAATFNSDDDGYAIYIDGQFDKSGVNPNPLSQQPADVLSFGTRTGSTEYWQGALRDLRVYNRRLCPSEIAELYGLVGHWKLDETSGLIAADSSGAGRNGTVVGTATWTAGAIDNALQLNGSTRVEVHSLMNAPKNITLSAWANLTAADSGGAEVVSLGDYFAIRLNEGSQSKAFFYNGSGWSFVAANQTFGASWHHVAAVFNDDQNYCKFYVDGTEAASASTTASIVYTGLGSKLIIGTHGDGKTTWDFTGRIDDVRVYSRALCPSEVQALHDNGNPFEGVQIIKWVEIQ